MILFMKINIHGESRLSKANAIPVFGVLGLSLIVKWTWPLMLCILLDLSTYKVHSHASSHHPYPSQLYFLQ